MSVKYREVSKAFDRVCRDYDAWYEGNVLFENELVAIKALRPIEKPALEIGVGTGRFAASLGLDLGLDPSLEMLTLAKTRGVKVVCGVAEALPFSDASLATVAFFFSLCFVEDPRQALGEAFRVLRLQGHLLLGIVPRESPWGVFYLKKAQEGHPLYRYARLLGLREAQKLARSVGFALEAAVSTLFSPPSTPPRPEPPQPGLHPEAGLVVMRLLKTG